MDNIKKTADIIIALKSYFSQKEVDRVILFGSFATGSNTKRSDLDLIVIKKTMDRFFERYSEFNDLYHMIDQPIDLLIYTPDEWTGVAQRPFFRRILREGKLLYER